MVSQAVSKVCIFLLLLLQSQQVAKGWWLLAAQLSASPHLAPYLPDNFHCNVLPGLTKKQRELCVRHPEAMRAIADGLGDAIDECQIQFSRERWNCSTTFDFGLGPMKVGTSEAAYLYAISAGGASHALARACADGRIPECGCGPPEDLVEYHRIQQQRKRALTMGNSEEFIWAGCSDDLKFANAFTRRFIDATERRHGGSDARSLMNLHNNRVGRKVLAQSMKQRCKCHGVSGSCVTKTCWRTVPDLEEFAVTLKRKYQRAKQVIPSTDKRELVLQQPLTNENGKISRPGRFLNHRNTHRYDYLIEESGINGNALPSRNDLIFLDPSPDYCVDDQQKSIGGTQGRECYSKSECERICCGRGWTSQVDTIKEHCHFVWCCEVKCESCTRRVERMFCQ